MVMETKAHRREFLRGLTTMIGSVAARTLVSGSGISVAMAYTPSADSHLRPGKVFSLAEMQLLKKVCAVVIPKTDTPGAADVDTHGFIDNQLFHCFDSQERSEIVALLGLIDQEAKKSHGKGFIELTEIRQFNLLTDLDLGRNSFDGSQRERFKKLKKLICFGYYTSEAGAAQELRYQAIPGGYKGSIPYKPGDKSWGSLGLRY